MRKSIAVLLLAAIALAFALADSITMSWSPVGNPANAADATVMTDRTTGYGSVGYNYNIGTYDVTVSQYVAFLNSNDPTGANTLALYNARMSNVTYAGLGYNSSAPSGSKYTVGPSNAQNPINDITWYDALRFANWLDNKQAPFSTETGAYTLLGGTPTPSNATTITRNEGATVFLPSENEWYKAAYYNPSSGTYYSFPTSSNTAPIASDPTALPNHANFGSELHGPLTNVGAYA